MSQGPEPVHAAWIEAPAGVVRFGVFELDCGTGELRKAGVLVRLRQQPFKVLAALVARPGQVVSREELRARLWGDETFVDFDQGLNSTVKEIRAALGDSSDTPLYVETLPRRGYRFIAPVDPLPPRSDRPQPPSTPVVSPPAERPIRGRGLRAAHVALTVAALLAAGYFAMRAPRAPAAWRQLTFRQGAISGARFAPNGDVVISAAWDGAQHALQILTPGVPDARTLPFEGAYVAAVLPGGEVAYVHTRPGMIPVLTRVSLAGGPPKAILDNVFDADVTTDGTGFAAIHLVAGRGARIEYPIGRPLGAVNAPGNLRLSPTGRHLAVIEHRTGLEDAAWVLILDADGRQVARSPYFALVTGLAWVPGGEEVLFTASTAGANTAIYAFDIRSRERLVMPASGRLVLHDVDPDGRALLERSVVRSEVRWVGTSGERDLSWFDGGRVATLSADGAHLLMNETGEAGGRRYGVYVRPTDGAAPVHVGVGRATGLSADGQWVVTVPMDDPSHIALLPIAAGEVRRIRHPGIAQYEWARLLPDGEHIVFAGGERDRNLRVWIGDLAGGPPRAITPEGFASRSNLASVAGRMVVAGCPPLRLCTYPFDGGEPRMLEGVSDSVALGIDGGGFGLLVRPRAAAFPVQVERVDLRTGARSPWHLLAPPDLVGAGPLRSLAASADGTAFAYDFERRRSQLYLVDRLE